MKIVNITVVILNSISAMKWTANKEEAHKFLQTRLVEVENSIFTQNGSKIDLSCATSDCKLICQG